MLGALRGGRSLSRAAVRIVSSASIAPVSHSSPSLRCAFRKPFAPGATATRSFHSSRWQLQEAAPTVEETPDQVTELTRFQELADHGLVSPAVIDTITQRMRIETMTDVQRLTINETLDGTDVIAQARTGTGKTLAFLMPIVQRVLKDKTLERRSRYGAKVDIRALIISPTRELAEQIAVEAQKVVSATDVRVQTAVGGTGKSQALQRMKREGCHILVGTPGRVKDILSDQYSGLELNNIEMFVLDEADRLLDIGFAPDIEEIQSYMPHREERDRQTLMFSATVPREVVTLVRKTLRPNFKFIRTTDPNEQPTHERVPQKVAFLRGLENRIPAILEIAHNAITAHEQDTANTMPFKAIVYFGSTADVQLSYEIFKSMRGSLDGSSQSQFKHPLEPAEVMQMHSKLTQAERTNNSRRFRQARSAILFSSDVTARGMDFPDVSHVIQCGLPRNDDDYIHRLGRTGRAGKSGEGWLIVREGQLREFKRGLGADLPIQEDGSLEAASVDMTQPGNVSEKAAAILRMTEQSVKATPFMQKAQAYMSMFGILKQEKWADNQEMVDAINDLARYGWGLNELPGINREMITKLGLRNVQGLNVQERGERRGFGDRGGSRGGFDRGFGGGYHERDPFGSDPFGSSGSRGRGRSDPFADQPGRNRGERDRGFSRSRY